MKYMKCKGDIMKSQRRSELRLQILFGIIGAVIMVVVIFLICTGIKALNHMYDQRETDAFGDGICQKCGGNLVYQQAVGHQMSTEYLYICDKCGDMYSSSVYVNTRSNKEIDHE